jgi:hypothetical protein
MLLSDVLPRLLELGRRSTFDEIRFIPGAEVHGEVLRLTDTGAGRRGGQSLMRSFDTTPGSQSLDFRLPNSHFAKKAI